MSEKIVGYTFSDDEIRIMHLPLTDRPQVGLNTPCRCPVCKPKKEPVK